MENMVPGPRDEALTWDDGRVSVEARAAEGDVVTRGTHHDRNR
ncbi:hypothetical protein QP948_07745 [Corynebacterium bovis]|nr:hypothetical protein [Corynebacterium bovis]MDK8511287.1 hypothetical protein [Corynebacterium bovis]